MGKQLLIALLLAFATTTTSVYAEQFSIQKDRSRVIQLVGEINSDSVMPGIRTLAKLSLSPNPGLVDLIIDSPGGGVFAGFQFITLMKQFQGVGGVVRCSVVSMAASMAFHILLHCNERHVMEETLLLWHRARVNVGGLMGSPMTVNEAQALAIQLRQLDNHIFSDISEVMRGASRRYLQYHFEKETMHVATELARAVPKFIHVHRHIGNLLESLLLDENGKSRIQDSNSKKSTTSNTRKDRFIYRTNKLGDN